jgi:cell division protein FtsI/penicillin-binding protein 2
VDLTIPAPGGGVAVDQVPLLPGLTVVPSGDREYPYETAAVEVDLSTLPEPMRGTGKKTIQVEGVGYHLIGRMKDSASKEDEDRRRARIKADSEFAARVLTPKGIPGLTEQEDRGEYSDEEACGQTGIEASQEDELRGLRGMKVRQLDTGQEYPIQPTSGRDVRLTIDVALEARVQAAMSKDLGLAVAQTWQYLPGQPNPTLPVGTALNGAAVVLEVDSGDILAMVSTPSIPRRLLKDDPGAVFDDPVNAELDVPWINRAISRPYPPGSIAKALILNGAVKLGKHSLDTLITCTGHLFPDKPNMFRCWIYKQHEGHTHSETLGPLSAPQALMVSCNIYFFTLGQKLGPEGIVATYSMFGLGQPMNLGLGAREEFQGFLGSDDQGQPRPASMPSGISIQDAIQMGIGQGPVAWTPLHAADAYATIARGGVRIRPHLVNDARSPETEDLGLDPRAVKEAMKGLWNSVNEDPGTGNHLTMPDQRHVPHFNIPGIEVWGKTGTATAPTIMVKPTRKDRSGAEVPDPMWDRGIEGSVIAEQSADYHPQAGRRVLRWGDHSWFVVLVGHKSDQRPLYAIAVMMEYAGSGGKVSGPIVNQIIHALMAEGYL